MEAIPFDDILRPLVRFCIRRGIGFQAFVDATRKLFVDEAAEVLRSNGETPNASRVSAMTGMNRRQIGRIQSDSDRSSGSMTLLARVVGQWQSDRRFMKKGVPAKLTFEGVESGFHRLVSAVSRDLNPYTVLKELLRTETVERTRDGLRLKKKQFTSTKDVRQGIRLLGDDVEDLIGAVEENIFGSPHDPNLHLRTEYTRIPKRHEKKVRAWLLVEGSKFHQRLRNYLAGLDLDMNAAAAKSGENPGVAEPEVRFSIGTFSRSSSSAAHHTAAGG